jgi:hypothetical protein
MEAGVVSLAGPRTWSLRARRFLIGASLVAPCACAARPTHVPGTLAPATLALARAGERETRRWDNFRTRLHPLARALVRGQSSEQAWLRDGVIDVPAASCAAAANWQPPTELSCSLVALDAGATAVMVMREPGAHADQLSIEHSWVFLSGFAWPLPLPAPRRAEYQRLRADLSKEAATSLWLAGFRAAGDPRLALELAETTDELEPDAAPPLASFQSCTLAPDERELVCRASSGDVIGIHPLRGARRLIARLGLTPALAHEARQPVEFSRPGELVLRVHAREHALCGTQSCELMARMAWPSAAPAELRWQRVEPQLPAVAARQL